MPSRILMEKMEFDSGLVVEIYDVCRQVAGDRWQVAFECESRALLDGLTQEGGGDFAKALGICRRVYGDTVRDIQRRERNFIPANQKEQILLSLVESFKEDRMPYLKHPEFPRRLVLAKAREIMRDPWKFGLTPESLNK